MKEIETHKIGNVFLPKDGPPKVLPATNQENQMPYDQKASSFVRSQRSIALRIKEDYDASLSTYEGQKLQLIQRLNEAIRALDALNQEKGELNERLITLFKFNRDVERQTLRSEDLMLVVDESLKEELKSEK